MTLFLFFAGIAASLAVGILVVTAKRREQQRTESVRAVAERLGWGFLEDVPFKSIPDLDRFELFRSGHSKKLKNLMTSPAGGRRAVVFEYAYTTGAGQSQSTHRQTVFYATSDSLDLPSFSLRPEHFFHRVAGAFGYQDIDIERRPEFSRLFLLRGEDEGRVRGMFSDAVAEFFERRPRTCAAGMGRELLHWRTGGRLSAEELERLITDGFGLATLFEAGPRM
jgi:hypothetical protein